MARINLLPWRTLLREQRRKRFLLAIAGVATVAVVGLFVAEHYIDRAVERQVARNSLIRSGIAQLDTRALQISELKERREQLVERMQTIETLQGNRSGTGLIFDQLARSLPDGVYFTDVKMTDRTIVISGVAQSNSLVSELMRNLDASHWLEAPSLIELKSESDAAGNHPRHFQMTVRQTLHVNDARSL